MNLYLVTQNAVRGYDTYDSMVVAAEDAEQARRTFPRTYCEWNEERGSFGTYHMDGSWDDYHGGAWPTTLDKIKVELIGKAAPGVEPGVIVSSFNAG